MKPFIGIKRIWYADPITTVTNAETGISGPEIYELIKEGGKAIEVLNSHQDTWGYTQDDPSVTDYVNELTGKVYFRDKTGNGAKTIAFTLGEYSFKQKADLQGGVATETSWQDDSNSGLVNKAVIAMTKTDNYIIFPNASVIGKGNFVEKNIGLGVTAVAQESPTKGIADEVWLDGSVVKDSASGASLKSRGI